MTASLLKQSNKETMHSVQKKVAKRKFKAVPDAAVKNKVKKVEIKLKKSALEKDLAEKNDQIKTLEENISKLEKKIKQ
jgi:hypothetical protein